VLSIALKQLHCNLQMKTSGVSVNQKPAMQQTIDNDRTVKEAISKASKPLEPTYMKTWAILISSYLPVMTCWPATIQLSQACMSPLSTVLVRVCSLFLVRL